MQLNNEKAFNSQRTLKGGRTKKGWESHPRWKGGALEKARECARGKPRHLPSRATEIRPHAIWREALNTWELLLLWLLYHYHHYHYSTTIGKFHGSINKQEMLLNKNKELGALTSCKWSFRIWNCKFLYFSLSKFV